MKNLIKKFSISVLTLSLLLSLTACKDNVAYDSEACKPLEGAEVTFLMSEINPIDSIVGKMDLAFKEKIEELSNGKMTIDLRTNNSLGKADDIINAIKNESSNVDIMRLSPNDLAGYGLEKHSIIIIPYLFTTRNDFWKFATSDITKQILNESYEKGLGMTGLFFGEEGFRCFFSTHPLTNMKDLQLQKIRMSYNDLSEQMLRAFYAYGYYDSFNTVYEKLENGKLDGAEQPISNYLSNKFYEVAPNLILDNHFLGITEVLIKNSTWNNLNEEQRNIIKEASKYAQEVNKQNVQAQEDESLKELYRLGVTITRVEDFTPWQKALTNIINTYSSKDPELYQSILDLINE